MVQKNVPTVAHISSLISSCVARKDVEKRHPALWKVSELITPYVVMGAKHSKQTPFPRVACLAANNRPEIGR